MTFNSYLQLFKCMSVIHVLNIPMMSSVWRLSDDFDDPNNRFALLLICKWYCIYHPDKCHLTLFYFHFRFTFKFDQNCIMFLR